MARKGNRAPGSEAGKDVKPTKEADENKDVVVDEAPTVETKVPPEGPPVEEEEAPAEEEVVDKAPEPEKSSAAEVDTRHRPPAAKKKRMFRIILGEQDNSDNNQDQLVTDPSDGKQFLIKRGFEVEVPEGVVNNLKESVVTKLSYDREGNEVWKDIPRFAITELGEVK